MHPAHSFVVNLPSSIIMLFKALSQISENLMTDLRLIEKSSYDHARMLAVERVLKVQGLSF